MGDSYVAYSNCSNDLIDPCAAIFFGEIGPVNTAPLLLSSGAERLCKPNSGPSENWRETTKSLVQSIPIPNFCAQNKNPALEPKVRYGYALNFSE